MKTKKELSSYQYRKIYKDLVGDIPKGWHVHHLDWDKSNNDILNLIALPKKFHSQYHYHITILATSENYPLGQFDFSEKNKGDYFTFGISLLKHNNRIGYNKNEKINYKTELEWLYKYFELKDELNKYIKDRDDILLKKRIIKMDDFGDYFVTKKEYLK